MFFNDGWWYLDPDGDVRGGIVLDNLAAAHDLPQMIGVFVDPGLLDVDGSRRSTATPSTTHSTTRTPASYSTKCSRSSRSAKQCRRIR